MNEIEKMYELLNEVFKCKKCGEYHTSKMWVDKTTKHLESIGLIVKTIPILTKGLLKEKEKYIYVCPNCKKICNLEDIQYLSETISKSLKKETTIEVLLKNEKVDYDCFYDILKENNIGNWKNIISTKTIENHIIFKIMKKENVSDLLSVIENKNKQTKHWIYDLENPKEVPIPINSKKSLINALSLKEIDLQENIVCLI